jgi:transcriptional regulator with XRE-family HTH domain
VFIPPNVEPVSRPAQYLSALRASATYGESNPFRAVREAFELTQVQASQRVGVSRSLWLAWERKERPITAMQLGQVAACFSLGRREVQWVLDWWGDTRVAELTIAQLNALNERVGSELVDPVEILFKLWEG